MAKAQRFTYASIDRGSLEWLLTHVLETNNYAHQESKKQIENMYIKMSLMGGK